MTTLPIVIIVIIIVKNLLISYYSEDIGTAGNR